MALLPFDVVEQILVRLDVEDLIRCKSVCKSCYYIISSPPFVKAHLKHSYNKDRNDPELEHRRISSYSIWDVDGWHCDNFFHTVGSCNGLVCISPRDAEFLVINPCTRELKNIETPPFRPRMYQDISMRSAVCWGFGYDSVADDYKVVAGFRKSYDNHQTLFYVLTLKSNTWKFIKEVDILCANGHTGIFYGGSLYWFMADENYKHTIVKLDLSTEVFYELPQPDTELYQFNACYRLGVIEESLCIYESDGLVEESFDSTDSSSLEFLFIWVMRKNNNNNSFRWEQYANDHWKSKFDVAHFLTLESHGVGPRSYVWGHDDGKYVPSARHYILASTFVKSLVSPHQYPHVSNNKNDNYYKEPMKKAKSHSHSFAPSLLIQFQTHFRCTLERPQEVIEGVEGAGKDNIKKRKRNKKRKRYVVR